MRHQRHNHYAISFIDLLLNLTVTFVALFTFAILLLNDPNHKKNDAPEKAKIMIVMDWDNNSSDDIDLWLLTPEPMRIGFNNPNGKIANLERDDLGKSYNYYKDNQGGIHYQNINREVITIRQKMDGHYVVDAYFYARHPDPQTNITSTGPVPVILTLIQIDPTYSELATQKVVLADVDSEETAFTFDIKDGNVINVRTDQQDHFVTKAQEEEGQDDNVEEDNP